MSLSLASRHFNCTDLNQRLVVLCNVVRQNYSDIKCKVFEVNVCDVSPEQQQQMCTDGYAQEFFRDFPCYCDDRCLSKLGATISGSIVGASLLIGMFCVAIRRRRKPVPDEEVEKWLSVARSDKPDPQVSQFSVYSFKWIPFVSVMAISLWFLISTVLVIAWNGDPEVSAFEVSYMLTSTAFMIFWLFSNIALIVNGARGLHLLRRELAISGPVEHTDTVHHIVVLPNYKEETDVMRATIMRLANQSHIDVKKNVTIVLAMEQGEDGYSEKGMLFRDEFLPLFREVVVTCHPRLPGEQPGKSSNMKWAYAALERFALGGHGATVKVVDKVVNEESPASYLDNDINYAVDSDRYFAHPDLEARTKASPDFAFDPESTVVTLMDADALSHRRFLASLGKKFEETKGSSKHMRFWQCPVAFYENLDEVDFVNRAVTIVFAFNELANTGVLDLGLVGCNPRVPVNTYSMSWRLFRLIEGGDNFVVADESHNLFKALHLSKGLVKLDPIFLPISVYNVTSDNCLEGFIARFTQIKRWMYGNAYEFSFWHGRYAGCSRSQNWPVPLLDKLPVLWRLFIFSSFNLVQPLFFALYGLSWTFYLKTPYFQTLSTTFVTFIMTIFMIINASIFTMHWFYVNELKIESVQKWKTRKKVFVTLFDALIGVGAATVFFVLFAGIAANAQLLFTGGLKWGTEGRAKSLRKARSTRTTEQAKKASNRMLQLTGAEAAAEAATLDADANNA